MEPSWTKLAYLSGSAAGDKKGELLVLGLVILPQAIGWQLSASMMLGWME